MPSREYKKRVKAMRKEVERIAESGGHKKKGAC